MPADETILTYKHDGRTYEIDHLGITYPETQWGAFAVYCDGEMVGEFVIAESMLNPEYRPAQIPLTNDELTEMAKAAVRGEHSSDEELADFMATQEMIGRHLPSQNLAQAAG